MESNFSMKESKCIQGAFKSYGINEAIFIQSINTIQTYLKTLRTGCSNNKKPRSMTWVC